MSELGEGWAGVDGPRGAVLHGRATKVAGPLGSTRGAALPPTWASIHISHKSEGPVGRSLGNTFKCVKRLVNQPGYQLASRRGHRTEVSRKVARMVSMFTIAYVATVRRSAA